MDIKEATSIVSKGIGYNIGKQLAADKNLDKDSILQAISDVFAGKGEAPDQEQFAKAAQIVQEEASKEIRAAGEEFLKENKTKEGIKTTESGLQYRVIKEGEGDSPSPSDTVTVHYEGKLMDGTIFDSSIKRGQPAQFGVSQVIPGWVEGLQLMKPGAKYQFFIPQELAYGAQGSGNSIPPYSPLIFEVELLK